VRKKKSVNPLTLTSKQCINIQGLTQMEHDPCTLQRTSVTYVRENNRCVFRVSKEIYDTKTYSVGQNAKIFSVTADSAYGLPGEYKIK
jgi:hypothetical protein